MACQRCRRRKQRCDLKHPSCSNCESAQTACLTYDAGKRVEIPRDYVSRLEAQVRRLQEENSCLQAQVHLRSSNNNFTSSNSEVSTGREGHTISGDNSGQSHDLVTSVRNTVVEPSEQPRFLGPSSGITLARMVMASIKTDVLPPSSSFTSSPFGDQSSPLTTASSGLTTEASLPPRHAADHLVDVYFQYRTPHLPIIQQSHAKSAVQNAYASIGGRKAVDRKAERDIFLTYMILAIALCNVPDPIGRTGRPLQSEGCFRSATHWIERVITYSNSDTETLRAILFLAQFASMCPWQGSLWHLSGFALRLCIDMGIHWESEEQDHNQDQRLLYERRRLWYSAYYFDRVLGITLGRPFGITDESVHVLLPNPWVIAGSLLGHETNDFEVHHQRAHNHLFTLTKLESEIKHVQHSLTWTSKLASPKPNYKLWIRDIQPRLQEWFSTIPNPAQAHHLSIFAKQAYWDAIYNNTILLLHRPNPAKQDASSESLSISYAASCKLIDSIKDLQRDGRLDVLWKSVYDLFMAGLIVIYCVWQSASIRSLHSVDTIVATMQSCASTLSAMSENFSAAAGCRSAFDALSTATVNWLVTDNAEEVCQSNVTFERQIGDLISSLQPSRQANVGLNESIAIDISMMLSNDNFTFGEILNSAAQWPENMF